MPLRIGSSKQALVQGLALFHLGLVLALTQLAVSLEIAVTTSYHDSIVKSLLLFLYPVSAAFVGLGAALDLYLRRRHGAGLRPDRPLRIAGAVLVLFLFVALRYNFLVPSDAVAELVGILGVPGILLAAWFVFLGVAMSRLLTSAHRRGGRWTGAAWAIHLAGAFVGYGVADPLLAGVGANAVLIGIGVALLIAPRLAILPLAVVLAFSGPLGLDERLEDQRDLRGASRVAEWKQSDPGDTNPRREIQKTTEFLQATRDADHVVRRWSRYGQLKVVRSEDRRGTSYLGFYNLFPQWRIAEKARAGSRGRALDNLVYGILSPDDRIAVIGVGAGRGLQEFPFDPHPNVVAIERDPAVVAVFRDERPALNGGVLEAATTLARDGRFAVESAAEPFDAVIIESARYQPTRAFSVADAPVYLYTREAIANYLGKLADDGLFVASFNYVSDDRRYLPYQVFRALEASGHPHTVLATDSADPDLYLVASPTERGLDKILGLFDEDGRRTRLGVGWAALEEGAPPAGDPLTDQTPFARWNTMSDRERGVLMGISGAMFLFLLGLTGAVGMRGRPRGSWNPVPFFLLIGVGHTAVVLHAVFSHRAYYGDEILTFIRLVVYFLVYSAVGSLLAARVTALRPSRWIGIAVTLMAFALYWAGTTWLPFLESRLWAREIHAAITLLPVGVLMGLFFPAGLASAHEALISRVLLADALGALGGYCAFYLLFMTCGSTVFLAAALVCYLGAVTVYPSRGGDD